VNIESQMAAQINSRIDSLLKYIDSVTLQDGKENVKKVQERPKAPKVKKQQAKAPKAKKQQPKAQPQKKQECKKKAPAAAPAAAAGAPADLTDELKAFALRHDFRVAKIVECEKHPNADSMWLEKVEMGDAEPRQVISGLVKYVPLDGMIGADIVAFANLKPANLRGIKSHAMVFCAKDKDNDLVQLMKPPAGAKPGERVWLEGMKAEFEANQPDKSINCKKKNAIWHKLVPALKTNANREMTLAGCRFMCSAGPITCESIPNAPIS